MATVGPKITDRLSSSRDIITIFLFLDLYLHRNRFCNYMFGSVLVICYCNTQLTEAGVMHETWYIYSLWSKRFFFIWEVSLAYARWFWPHEELVHL